MMYWDDRDNDEQEHRLRKRERTASGNYRSSVRIRQAEPVDVGRKTPSTVCLHPHRPIEVVGLTETPWRIYPLVDHIADKFAAMLEVHGDGKRMSSRYRDLVDVVLIASSERIDGATLRRAILTETRLRGVPVSLPFRAPQNDAWRSGYRTLLKELPGLDMTFDDACGIAVDLFSIVEVSTTGKIWNSTTRTWDES